MKYQLDSKIHAKLTHQDRLYGTATVGSRGQMVIPAQARKDLKIAAGAQLLVLGKFGKALGLVKVEQFEDLVSMIMKNISGTDLERDFKAYLNKTFGNLRTIKK